MIKINWKVRFRNKLFLVTFVTTVIAFIYQMLALFGVVPKISEDTVEQLAMILINIFVAVGVVVDPTTKGVSDSTDALNYDQPK